MEEEDRKIEETTRSRLELDHAIGYTRHFANTCLYHPKKSRTIVYNTGTVLVVSDLSSVPHKQQFIHGHDAGQGHVSFRLCRRIETLGRYEFGNNVRKCVFKIVVIFKTCTHSIHNSTNTDTKLISIHSHPRSYRVLT